MFRRGASIRRVRNGAATLSGDRGQVRGTAGKGIICLNNFMVRDNYAVVLGRSPVVAHDRSANLEGAQNDEDRPECSSGAPGHESGIHVPQ